MTFVTFLEDNRHGLKLNTVEAFVSDASWWTNRLYFLGYKQVNLQVWPAVSCRNGGAR